MRRPLLLASALLAGCDVTGPQPATVTFCADQIVGGRIAIRDDALFLRGAAPWTLVDSPDGKTFSFDAPRRLSIAFTEGEGPISSDLRMFQLTANEIPKLNCIPGNIGPIRAYTGTISGIATGRSAQLSLGPSQATRGNGAFTFNSAAIGAADLVAFMRVANVAVEKFIVRRGLDLPTGSVFAPLDFAGTEAVQPRTNTVTITGNPFPIAPFYRLLTNGTNTGLPASQQSGVMTVASLPTTIQAPTDFYVIGATMNSGGTLPEVRTVSLRFVNPADRTLAFGPALQSPVTSFSSEAKPAVITLTLPVQAEYSARADVTLTQSDEGVLRAVTITQTRAYRGDASSWNFETPLPSSLDAKSIQLNPKAPTSWIAYAASADFSSLFDIGDATEITVREAYRDGGVGAGPTTRQSGWARINMNALPITPTDAQADHSSSRFSCVYPRRSNRC